MIIVTGAAGFIGSCLVKKLNQEKVHAVIAVDHFDDPVKHRNLKGLRIQEQVEIDPLMNWLDRNAERVAFVFHMGAITNTSELDTQRLNRFNTQYTKDLWTRCVAYQIPIIYASSAATYGRGERGYDDDPARIPTLQPLNPYGQSKQDFDVWALQQEKKPIFWAGLKFFNVYGPNEYHKGRMASVVWHAYNQIQKTGQMKLFRSHDIRYRHGEQMRDFVYVNDVVDACYFLMLHHKDSGIYNIGSGTARTFLDLTRAVFNALHKPESIVFVDTPLDIRDRYQYFTEAKMEKFRKIGYAKPFYSLEEGVADYVKNDLLRDGADEGR